MLNFQYLNIANLYEICKLEGERARLFNRVTNE